MTSVANSQWSILFVSRKGAKPPRVWFLSQCSLLLRRVVVPIFSMLNIVFLTTEYTENTEEICVNCSEYSVTSVANSQWSILFVSRKGAKPPRVWFLSILLILSQYSLLLRRVVVPIFSMLNIVFLTTEYTENTEEICVNCSEYSVTSVANSQWSILFVSRKGAKPPRVWFLSILLILSQYSLLLRRVVVPIFSMLNMVFLTTEYTENTEEIGTSCSECSVTSVANSQ